MSDDEDPEVIRDLQLRAASEHDSSRARSAKYDWTTPKPVAAWVCRVQKCRKSVLVNAETVDALKDANSVCASKGWELIHEGEVVMCEDCRAVLLKYFEGRRTEIQQCMRDVIRQLKEGQPTIRVQRKDGIHACNEREAFDQLQRWGHPDVKGLEQHLREKAMAGSGKRERRSKL